MLESVALTGLWWQLIRKFLYRRFTQKMTNVIKSSALLTVAFAGLLLSLSVQAAALEAELSKVTLFVEGMMKSRGGVT
ncbi:MAG: hypothetical protein PsegKO_25840 [Pseudohongiellaceae bacterium]|jgi:hypothetical protein